MNTPHQDLQKAKEELIDLLKHHEAVLAFQEAEKAIGQVPQISHLAGQMKAYQQEAVLFQKIEKQRAYEEAGEQADLIQHELENLPIVQDYRQKMQDASDLIQYVTKSIEERINEELRKKKKKNISRNAAVFGYQGKLSDAELSHLQRHLFCQVKDYLQMSMRPSRVWIYWKMLEQVRNTVLFSGSWMKPRQLWECVSCVLGLTVFSESGCHHGAPEYYQVFLDNFFERSDRLRVLKGLRY